MEDKELEQPLVEETNDSTTDAELTEDELLDSIRAEALKLQQPEESQINETAEVTPETKTETETKNEEVLDVTATTPDFVPVPLKSKNLTIEAKSMDELIQLAQQGLNYTQKTQELAKHRPIVDYVSKHNITQEDLHLLADLKSGNADALKSIAKQNGVDMYALDVDGDYKPSEANRMSIPSEVDLVAESIMQDTETATKIQSLNQHIPDDFRNKLASDANMLRLYANDVKSGMAERILPEAVKLKAINPNADFLEIYSHVGMKIAESMKAVAPTVPVVAQPVVAKPNIEIDRTAKQKAMVTGSSSSSTPDEIDIWEDGLSDADLIARIQSAANKLRN